MEPYPRGEDIPRIELTCPRCDLVIVVTGTENVEVLPQENCPACSTNAGLVQLVVK